MAINAPLYSFRDFAKLEGRAGVVYQGHSPTMCISAVYTVGDFRPGHRTFCLVMVSILSPFYILVQYEDVWYNWQNHSCPVKAAF